MAAKITQNFVDIATSRTGKLKVTQNFTDLNRKDIGHVRVTQNFIEIFYRRVKITGQGGWQVKEI